MLNSQTLASRPPATLSDYLRSKAKTIAMVAGPLLRYPSDIPAAARWLASIFTGQTPVSLRMPLLPYRAIRFLDTRMNEDSRVFEFGSGGSTLWFAERARSVVSIEHDPAWRDRLTQELAETGASGSALEYDPPADLAPGSEGSDAPHSPYTSEVMSGDFREYVTSIDRFPDASFVLILKDGRCRAMCLQHALPKVKRGGVLVLDDSERSRYQALMNGIDWPRRTIRGHSPWDLSPEADDDLDQACGQ